MFMIFIYKYKYTIKFYRFITISSLSVRMQGWKRIEKYQFNLNKVIGEGSYATVYWGKSV